MKEDNTSYNWPGVLEFLHSEYQKVALKENMWFLEKKELHDQIKQLEGKLAASENVNSDLKHKNIMLENCLRQIKNKNGEQKEPEEEPEIPIPQRRPKSNKHQVSKILSSLGINSLMDNIAKDIKNKPAAQNMNIQIPTGPPQQSQPINTEPSKYKEIAHLEEHQDGVRDLCFLSQNTMVSVSEDSTMKLWNIEKPREKIDCLATIREHAGPIFTAIEGEGHLFTGGMEGVVRCWNFPKKISPGLSHKKCLTGSWNNSEDQKLQPIWQLLYYPQRKILFSTSSEVAVRAFQIQFDESTVNAKHRHSYVYQSKHAEEEDIPTAICMHQGSLYAGYVNNNFLVEFNIDSQKAHSSIQFQADGQISTNRIASNGQILVGAFEDAMIRVFDKSKVVHSFEAHEQSVMSLSFTDNPFEMLVVVKTGPLSYGTPGSIPRYVPSRYFHAIQAHKSKYDEAGHCVSVGGDKLVASGGADGVIKMFKGDS